VIAVPATRAARRTTFAAPGRAAPGRGTPPARGDYLAGLLLGGLPPAPFTVSIAACTSFAA
jgi:hypothetical protein